MKRLLCSGIGLAISLAAQITTAPTIQTDFFRYDHGWLGADAAYSIPVDAETTLWLFGDTFVGNHRAESTMIHNSVAIRRCAGACVITYWWSGKNTAKQDSFFRTSHSNYFWPLDGFMAGGHLYIFLEEMHATEEGGAFGFDYSSIQLATVSNPTAQPDKWLISYRTISQGNQVVPGIATVVVGENDQMYAYAFTLFRRSAREPFVGLIRCPLVDLAGTTGRILWRYLTNKSEWSDWTASTSPNDAWKAFSGNVTEMSVKYHAASKSWLAIFPTPGFLTKTASYSSAARLSGPWTEPRPFFHYPEMEEKDRRYTPNVFCYAAKEHPELEIKGELAFTYACNSQKEPEIFDDMRLYRPELVRQGTLLQLQDIRGALTH